MFKLANHKEKNTHMIFYYEISITRFLYDNLIHIYIYIYAPQGTLTYKTPEGLKIFDSFQIVAKTLATSKFAL